VFTYLFILPTDIKIGLILLSISPGGVHLGLLIALPLYAGRLLTDYITNSQRIATILGIVSIIIFIGFNVLTSAIESKALHRMDWNALSVIVC
jgi:predicted Na+-dependent transporter